MRRILKVSRRYWISAQLDLREAVINGPSMQTVVIIMLAVLLFRPVVASADADRWDLDSFWRQQRASAEKQGKRFVLDEIRRESLARSAEIQRLETAIVAAPADSSLQAMIDYQRQGVENLAGNKTAIEAQIEADAAETREAMRAYKAKIDESTAQKKAADMEKASEWAHHVDEETRREIEAADQERRREAKAASTRRAREEQWARDNCGQRPNNIVSGVTAYLRRYAHNPDSVKMQDCGEPIFTAKCWKVTCNYRANNRLGALNLYSQDFYIGNGHIVGGGGR